MFGCEQDCPATLGIRESPSIELPFYEKFDRPGEWLVECSVVLAMLHVEVITATDRVSLSRRDLPA
jgi:hypothetical protein